MNRFYRYLAPIFVSFCLLIWLGYSQLAYAHGGGKLQISNQPIGDCLVSVWSAPPQARANRAVHITVGVSDKVENAPILDATVDITLVDAQRNTAVVQTSATTAQSANRLFYEADIATVPIGSYYSQINVACHGQQNMVQFAFEVKPATNPLFTIAPLTIAAIAGSFLFYRSWQGRTTAVDTPPKRRPKRPIP